MDFYIDEYLSSYLDDPLTIGDPFLLVEAPSQVNPDFLLDLICKIIRKGLTPILAHPE
jgi:tyrosine-protein phosphatase YwqE